MALSDMIAKDSKLNSKEVKEVIDSTFQLITQSLANGDSVTIKNFGKFGSRQAAARNGVNPQTQEAITIPAQRRGTFGWSPHVKNMLKEKN
eukprot:CAMPEP_0114360482 /NCGR_PEP_ID=MMETSP0101-20121206/23902_1 /TAXON_ID=38822 ORGANISM="Pteridomonas danica, Strain PT" /NCGR_SAMPLE_ID=MMETSP0101 /ASSEMBLY_ACC=CAM_ASM_000211 /LENGTH=90 /DNA_ID=CAMNT_0001504751 /DNA_START=137 /DNA_END=409 /DNA_ORIENTATION=+